METLELTRNFWQRRRVFVTGHTGFKGAWLLLMLRELGAEVTGYSLTAPTEPSIFELLKLERICNHTIGDVRDLAGVQNAVQQAKPHVVLHLAAQPLVRASYEAPVDTYATNVMGTVNVLEACRSSSSVRSVVVITTDKCYENFGWAWGYRENDRLGGHDPYSNSKAAAELVVDSYRRSFFDTTDISLASARAGNVIGGGDFATDRLVPDAIRAFMAGKPVQIRNPYSVRPWQHVLDPLFGYLLLAERLDEYPDFAQAWNFGPQTDESASVGDVADILAERWGQNARWDTDGAVHPHEAATLKLDSTKARTELGWRPKLDLPNALRLTTDWFQCYHDSGDLNALSVSQVSDYLALCDIERRQKARTTNDRSPQKIRAV